MEDIAKVLQGFSITEQETKIYTSCLKLGKSSVTKIAELSALSRTNAYFHIKNLIKKKILQEIIVGKKTFLTAVQPSVLLARLQTNVNVFKRLVPQLESLSIMQDALPQIDVLESKAGFIKIYDEIMDMPHGSEFKVMENLVTAEAELSLLTSKEYNKFLRTIIKKKITTKALFSSELLKNIQNEMAEDSYSMQADRMWNLRVLPEEKLPIKNFLLLYANKAAFLTPDNSVAVIIQDKNIVTMIDTMFEIVFAFAENVQNPWGEI